MKGTSDFSLSGLAKALTCGLVALMGASSISYFAYGDSLYVGNEDGNDVVKINSCGHASVFAPTLPNSNDPQGLAFDSSGNLFVAYDSGCGSQIEKFDPLGNGILFASWETGVNVCYPEGLACDTNNSLYMADFFHGTILKFDSSGLPAVFADSGMYTPYGIAFDGNGNLYVGNLYSNTIVRFDSSGHGSVFADASSGLDGPVGLAFDSKGNLYVANNGFAGASAGTIEKFDSSGNGSVFATAGPGLRYPLGLAFDSRGNLYVANYGYNNIVKFDTNGNRSVFADSSAGLSGPSFLAVQSTEPTITLLGDNPLTNECHTTFTDPGATASEDGTDLSSNIVVSGTADANMPGTYTLTYTVTDALDNCATATRTVVVVDTSPPVITCPAKIIVNAVSPNGAFVSFAVTATDECSTATVTSTPASGSLFAISDTTVSCIATNVTGNEATCSFTVHVKGAAEQINDLIALVQALNLKPWTTYILAAELQSASNALRRDYTRAACIDLDAFIFEVDVQTWWGQIWPPSRARLLIRNAQRIQNVLGCYDEFSSGHY